jgi:hypothetical protein
LGDRCEDVVQGLQCAAAFAALEIFREEIVAGVVTVQSRVVIFSNFGAIRNVPNHHVLRFSVRVPQPFVVSLASGCRRAEERVRRLPVSEVTSYAEEAQFKGEASDPLPGRWWHMWSHLIAQSHHMQPRMVRRRVKKVRIKQTKDSRKEEKEEEGVPITQSFVASPIVSIGVGPSVFSVTLCLDVIFVHTCHKLPPATVDFEITIRLVVFAARCLQVVP